jgi:hypothetical protein
LNSLLWRHTNTTAISIEASADDWTAEKLLCAVGLIQVRYPAMPCGIANFNGS